MVKTAAASGEQRKLGASLSNPIGKGGFNAMSPNQNRHLSDRLIQIIESNTQELTQGTVKQLQSSPRAQAYHKLSYGELHDRSYEVYHNLGCWLREKSDRAVQTWYNELGETRCQEDIPLAEVLWSLVLTKDFLIEYLGACYLVDSAMQLYQQQEFDRMIGHFFDRVFCYTAEGYGRRASEQRNSLRANSRRVWQQTGFLGHSPRSHK